MTSLEDFLAVLPQMANFFDHTGTYRARTELLPQERRAVVLNINDRQVGQVKLITFEDGTKCARLTPYDIRLQLDGSIWKQVGYSDSTAPNQQIRWIEPEPDDLYLCGGAVYLLTRCVFLFTDEGIKTHLQGGWISTHSTFSPRTKAKNTHAAEKPFFACKFGNRTNFAGFLCRNCARIMCRQHYNTSKSLCLSCAAPSERMGNVFLHLSCRVSESLY